MLMFSFRATTSGVLLVVSSYRAYVFGPYRSDHPLRNNNSPESIDFVYPADAFTMLTIDNTVVVSSSKKPYKSNLFVLVKFLCDESGSKSVCVALRQVQNFDIGGANWNLSIANTTL